MRLNKNKTLNVYFYEKNISNVSSVVLFTKLAFARHLANIITFLLFLRRKRIPMSKHILERSFPRWQIGHVAL